MKPPCSLRPMVLFVGLALASCTLDGKGLSGGADAGASGGAGTATGGRPAGSGGSGTGAVGSGGEPASTGGRDVPGSGGTGTGGGPGTGGTESRTGGAGGGLLPATGGAGGGPLSGTGGAGTGGRGTGGAGTGGRGTGGSGGMGTGGRGTGGAATGGAATGGAPACSPTTCPNGCCQSGTCVTTNRTDQRCGSGGMACAPCGACFQCSNAGTCTPEEGARWDVTCVSATIAATNSGSPWDPGSGPLMPMAALPDPYCQLNIDGDDRPATDSKTDTLAPVWNESVVGRSGSQPTTALLMGMSSRWTISVYDMDSFVAEEICSIPGHLTATDLAAGTITYTNKQSCTNLTIKVTCAQQN